MTVPLMETCRGGGLRRGSPYENWQCCGSENAGVHWGRSASCMTLQTHGELRRFRRRICSAERFPASELRCVRMVGTLERSTAYLTGHPPSDMKTHIIYTNRYKNNSWLHLKEKEVVGAGERTSYCSFTVVLQDITPGEAGAPGSLRAPQPRDSPQWLLVKA